MYPHPVDAEQLPVGIDEQLRQACAELERRLQAGEDCSAEDYLEAWPDLAEAPDAALELIFTEFVVRERLGQNPSPGEWCARFPRWREDFLELVGVHRLVAPTVPGVVPGRPGPAWASRERERPEGDGRRLGHYELLDEVGRGGMGVVYRARQACPARIVAVKVILAGEHAGAEELARFHAEAEAVARLQHPNIVQVFEVGDEAGQPFFSMEFIEGESLDKRLADKPCPPAQAAALVQTLAGAVQHAHERGVVHRDLKPANVLLQKNLSPRRKAAKEEADESTPELLSSLAPWRLGESSSPKITDFGLAKLLERGPGLTPTEAFLGTPGYMAPEQARGRAREVGPGADVWALGAILYECLTGRPPFQADSAVEVLRQVLTEEPVPPRRLRPGVSRDLETICLKCLEKEARNRYASAGELAEDLRRNACGQPIRARPPGALYRFGKFTGRHKVAVSGVTAVFLTLVIGVIGTSVGMVRARAAEREAQQLLANSFARTGELAMRRGEWRAALESFDRALEAGHPDSARLRLLKVRAFCGLHELPKAAHEVEALARRTDLGELAASVLLWQADIALAGSLDDEDALKRVAQALKHGLPPAEKEYALGLLAETSPDAVRHFRRATELDPFHPRANGMLAVLLIVLGQLAEARQQVAVARLLFPDDPTFFVLQAQISALEGNLAGARETLKRAEGRLGERQTAAARALIELFYHARDLVGLVGEPNASLPLALLQLAPCVTRAWGFLREREGGYAPLFQPVPPVLLKALRPLSTVLPRLLIGSDQAVDALRRAVRVHPDGIFYLYLGLLLSNRDRWTEAEEAFQKATQAWSIIPVKKQALYAAAGCEWKLAGVPGPGAREMKAQALRHTRELLALGPIPAGQADTLSYGALARGELETARQLAGHWEQQARGDLALLRRRLAIEVRAGADGAVVDLANRILAKKPNDAEALRQRAAAVARLVQQGQKPS